MTTARPGAAAPQTVQISFWLYIAGAALGLIGLIVGLVTIPAAIEAGIRQAEAQGAGSSDVDVRGIATAAAIGAAVVASLFAVVFSVLTIVFALKMRQGRNWARIVLAVFAALQIFGVAGNYGIGALHFLVVLAALILSFLPASNAWFRAVNPRPAIV